MDGADTGYEDAERLRAGSRRARDAATRRPGVAGQGAPCVVASTTTAGSTGQKFFTMAAQDVTGAEAEGGAGTLTPTGFTFFALNLGSAVPPSGTPVICTQVDYRWTFRYDG